MSHELQFPIIDPEPIWDWYYYVPVLNRQEWDGIQYDNVQYGWKELDYRFGVQYDSAVPEPSFVGLVMGLALLTLVILKK